MNELLTPNHDLIQSNEQDEEWISISIEMKFASIEIWFTSIWSRPIDPERIING